PIRGDRNHNTSQGLAIARFDGIQRCTTQPTIPLNMLARPKEATNNGCRRGALQGVTWAEVHSSNPRREIRRRYQTRRMASSASPAWCGSSAASATVRSRSCATFEKEKLFSPWRVVAIVRGCAKGWKSSCMATTRVETHPICEEISQEAMSKPRLVTGIRLRRKLSKTFQRLNQERGFGPRRPPGWGTRGNVHSAICQSPRIQRCCRRV